VYVYYLRTGAASETIAVSDTAATSAAALQSQAIVNQTPASFTGAYVDAASAPGNVGNYVHFSDLSSDMLYIYTTTGSGNPQAFSGFQIVAVPEPASLGLGVAGLGLLLRRRRRGPSCSN
jgi:hypothetical protein